MCQRKICQERQREVKWHCSGHRFNFGRLNNAALDKDLVTEPLHTDLGFETPQEPLYHIFPTFLQEHIF